MPDLPFDAADPRLAAAAWSRLVEPGDPAAGALVAHLGPVDALGWLCSAARVGTTARGGRPWEQAVSRWLPRLPGLDVRRELDTLDRLGGTLVLPGEEHWPAGLDDLPVPPFVLWVRGDPAALHGRSAAVVGARAATTYGQRVAADIGLGLAEAGVAVVSGGAYGIDAAAHRGALAGEGVTVAVLAGGVDRLYPAGNAALLESVLASGAVAAEVPPGCAPSRSRFLARNRLIAAMTGATVVVEAAWRSGALSTAARAAEVGRPVAAVPGPVTSMASAGCHRLLREGAVCVTDAAEVRELLAPAGEDLPAEPAVQPGLLDDLDPVAARVLDALPVRGAAPVASVARTAGLDPAQVRAALGHLELAGRAERHGSSWRRPRVRA
ncbi:DNA-processing protein DprA [Georgenia sp. TF02-10]|uniref:DNA-processing protein DprA n=1 Tax=Georgenia sp. TF02-10 TaxID=2917725 RepID=UPI001FA6D387|nr:DNA-processing protein DprA [Georgenia sp. TF02-10]UNX55900.1 DNA-processing protein DprA [Georgenia sp. TF02-10]